MTQHSTDRHTPTDDDRKVWAQYWAKRIGRRNLEPKQVGWLTEWLAKDPPREYAQSLLATHDRLSDVDEAKMRDDILRLHFQRQGWPWVEPPGDMETLREVIARTKLGSSDWAAFVLSEPDLARHLTSLDVWHWRGRSVGRQKVDDLAYAANTIWKGLEKQLDEDQRKRIADRVDRGLGRRSVSGRELSDEVAAFLKMRRFEDYTYNQLAKELNVHWREVSKSLKWLVRHPDPRQVIEFEKRIGDKTSKRYKHCPERAAIEDGRGNPMKQSVMAVVLVLLHHGALGKRELREAVRRYLGRADNTATDEALRILFELDAVERAVGPRGKTTYRYVKGFKAEAVRDRYEELLAPWERAEAC